MGLLLGSSSSKSSSGSSIVYKGPVYGSDGKLIGNMSLTQEQVDVIWKNNPTLAKKSGLPKASTTSSKKETPKNNDEDNIKSSIEKAVETVVSSGKKINPNINFDDISIEQFLAEAEKTIAPEYKQKFNVILQDLDTTLGRLGYDLNSKIEEVRRTGKKVREQGRETLAGRGTAFSSDRSQFEQDVTDAEARDIESGRELTFRSGQDAFTASERALGTNYFKSNAPYKNLAGRDLQLSGTPLVGSLESEKQYAKEAIARQLQTDEYNRRAFTISSLGFQ